LLLRATHDGYADRFSTLHQRSWRLARDGSRLDGEDVFYGPDGNDVPKNVPDQFAIRFHLHFAVKASRRTDGNSVLLVLPSKETWLFTAQNMRVELADSVFLSATDGPRRTSQIVVAGRARTSPRVIWTFVHTSVTQADRRDGYSGPELPL